VSSNNNNTHASVYGAVIMTKAIARVHPVYLMNAVLLLTPKADTYFTMPQRVEG